MRNLKKFLALVLALMMAMSLMVTANAATENVEYDADGYQINDNFQEAVTVLSGMGVIKGYDDGASFGPQRKITRAEAAALIYRLATGDVTDASANLYAVYGNFPDVKQGAWYAGYVGYCANYGIIKGRTDGTFDPTADVTGYEILAMILRVVGYDKNGEFSGGNWAYNVATLSTSLGVKKQVNAANYGEATFYQAATREVVASLLFETIAYVPKVIYVGSTYANTGMTGGLLSSATNPTVGYEIFGLRSNHGIVVGNEETGEDASTTKIGFDLIGSAGASNYYDFDNIDNTLSFSRRNGTNLRSAYLYESGYNSSGANGNVTLAFKWKSGLDYFGHKVKVWYSDKSSAVENVLSTGNVIVGQFPTNLDTYAVFDETTNAKVIHGAIGDLDLSKASPDADNGDLADMAKFDTTYGVYWNYAFGPTQTTDYQVKPSDSGNWTSDSEFTSPIKEYNGTDHNDDSSANYPLYLAISNHPDGKVDMIISLELTITQIAQQNDYYTSTPSVGVFNDNNVDDITDTIAVGGGWTRKDPAKDYFGTYGNYTAATDGVSTVYTQIAQSNLKNSTKTLNDKVVAIAITGTNGAKSGSNETGAAADPLKAAADRGNATKKLGSSYYYKLSKLTNVVPATVYTVNTKDGTVTLSDGSTMKVSSYANVVDAGFATAAGVKVPGMNPAEKWPQVNASYNFTLDREGNYIYWEPITSNTDFVYATYLDYGTPLSTSTFTYQITYVDDAGNGGKVADVTNYNRFTVGTPGAWSTHNFTDVISSSNSGYSSNQMLKRDANSLAGGIEPGRYIGYTLSGGTLREVTTQGSTSGFYQGGTANFASDAADLAATGHSYTNITASDALAGAKQVATSDLFLTENTVFHIVSGAGTDSQKVTTYNGLSKLLEGNRSVVIDGGLVPGTSKLFYSTARYPDPVTDSNIRLRYADMTYYSTEPFTYAQNYGYTYGSAQAARVVYIPAEAVTFNKANSSSLYFVGDSSSTIINAYGENAVQFEMFKDGKPVNVWVEGNLGDNALDSTTVNLDALVSVTTSGRSSAGTILRGGDNVFYALEDTGKKTNFNETIYKIVPVADSQADANDIVIGRYYGYNVDGGVLGIYNTSNFDWQNGSGTNKPTSTPKQGAPKDGGTRDGSDEARYVPTTNALQAAFIDVNAVASRGQGTLYNVAGAAVASADDAFNVTNVEQLSHAASLYDNFGVRVSCVLSADSTRVVDYIYVNTALPPQS